MRIILGIALLLMVAAVYLLYSSSIEGFELRMRPWFGYEPGYGPGWGRKGCCSNVA